MTVKNNLLWHLIVEDGKNEKKYYVAKIMPCQLKTTQALVYKVYFKLTFRTGTYGGQKKTRKKEGLQLAVNVRLNVFWYTAYK